MIKFCKKCQLNLPVEKFSKDSSTKDGFNFYCKLCKASAAKDWKNRNKEKVKKSQREWQKANTKKRSASYKKWRASNLEKARAINAKYNRKRRAWISGSKSSEYETFDVIEMYGSICYICKTAIDLSAPRSPGVFGWEHGLHIDHLIPLSKKGDNSLQNVRPSHAICNLKKGTKQFIINEHKELNK